MDKKELSDRVEELMEHIDDSAYGPLLEKNFITAHEVKEYLSYLTLRTYLYKNIEGKVSESVASRKAETWAYGLLGLYQEDDPNAIRQRINHFIAKTYGGNLTTLKDN